MENRKVMLLGRSSLVVSLPKDWTDLNNVNQGDELSLEVQGDQSLLVYPTIEEEEDRSNMTLYIDADEDKTSIARSIIACYLNGYSHIKLISRKIFSTPQQREIRRIARILYIRIIESDSKTIKMNTLVDESKTSALSNLKRMHMICMSMCNDALNALLNNDSELAKTVYSLDDDVDQFCFFILRLLRSVAMDMRKARQLNLSPIDAQDYQVLVYRIEHVADQAAMIAKHVILLKSEDLKIPDSLVKLIHSAGKQAVNAYERSMDSFFSGDVSQCNDIINQQDELEETDREIASKAFLDYDMKAITVCSVCSLRDAITRIGSWAASIAETAVLRSYTG